MLMKIVLGGSLWWLSLTGSAQSVQQQYYADSTLRARGATDAHGKTGLWTYYYPSGIRSAVENYQQGQLHGEVLYYDFT